MKDDHETLMLCECSSCEHQLIICWNDSEDEVYVSIHLANSSSFFKRIWQGIKHMFGYKSRYGDFDEVILRKEDADKLQAVVDHLKNAK